jgi:hypothetical protein
MPNAPTLMRLALIQRIPMKKRDLAKIAEISAIDSTALRPTRPIRMIRLKTPKNTVGTGQSGAFTR